MYIIREMDKMENINLLFLDRKKDNKIYPPESTIEKFSKIK